MNKTEFTPGEWKMNGVSQSGKNNFNIVGTALGGTYKIARVPFIISGLENLDERNKAESEANAHLIASAPELLNALQHAYDTLISEGYNPYGESVQILEKAINKALNK